MCHTQSERIKFVGCQHRGTILEEVSAFDPSEDSVPSG